MRRLAVCGAAALVVLAAAFTASAADAVRAADCWLLDETALAQAQTQGHCRDVFARSAAPEAKAVAKPEAKPARARPAKAARRTPRKAAPNPWAELERLMGGIKAGNGSTGQSQHGGIDHLAYGRVERTPVQR